MAVVSFPNVGHNNRVITPAEHEQLVAPLGGSGLIGYTGVKPVTAAGGGRYVVVKAGTQGWIRGTKFVVTTDTQVPMTANGTANPRKDLIVARLTRSNFEVTLVAIAGAAAVTPLVPAPVRNDTIDGTGLFDLPLAEANAAAGYTTVNEANLTNRAWWLSVSGYQGFEAARPPVEPGAQFQAHDTGVTYVGTAGGTWIATHYNSGWVALEVTDGGWSALTFEFARTADQVVGNIRIARTGSAYGPDANAQFGILSDKFAPKRSVWAPYHCTLPLHSGHLVVQPNGYIVFAGSSQVMNTGANLIANPTWVMD